MLAESLCVSLPSGCAARAAPLAGVNAFTVAARAVVPVAHACGIPSPTRRQRRAELMPGFAGEEHRLARAAAPHDRVNLAGAERVAQRVDEGADFWHRRDGSGHGLDKICIFIQYSTPGNQPMYISTLSPNVPPGGLPEGMDELRALWLDGHLAMGEFVAAGAVAAHGELVVIAGALPQARLDAVLAGNPLVARGFGTYTTTVIVAARVADGLKPPCPEH